MASIGIEWIRLEYNYNGSTDGTNHGGASAATIQNAVAAGLKVLVVLGDGTAALPMSAGYKASNGWMRSAVTYLASLGVHAFEMVNEPNLAQNWGGSTPDPAAYTTLLKTIYPIIKAADPTASAIMGGLAGWGEETSGHTPQGPTGGNGYHPYDWMYLVYQNGGKAFFDALNVHPYDYSEGTPATANPYNLWSTMGDLRTLQASNNDSGKRIWVTEYGVPTGTDAGYTAYPVSMQQQTITEAAQIMAANSYYGPSFFYQWQDSTDDFGLYTAGGAQKASYATYAGVTLPTDTITVGGGDAHGSTLTYNPTTGTFSVA
ncbi:hypothetical protein DEI86_07765 [Curtobacterium sp. MCBD17_028]|nr:hypothetical protein DEI86_07765 [Curtobacterium sp. MCBD17_028]